MRRFRNHGISTDFKQRNEQRTWYYEMVDLGYNYRITDFQCALGKSQLRKLPQWIARRKDIAHYYNNVFAEIPEASPLAVRKDVSHAYHLYVIQLELDRLKVDRCDIFNALRSKNIGVNVHYLPVHLHPFYRQHFKTTTGDCKVAEAAYDRLLSLPIFPSMSDQDVEYISNAVLKICNEYRK